MRRLNRAGWRDRAALLILLCLAAALRFSRGDVVEYFHDDAMLATLALDLAAGGPLPTVGILSSTGIPNSPASVILLALPFAISRDALFAIHFVMLLNVAGVGLLWLLARIHAGARVAFAAGLLYACNPWAILFSRKLWAQELHTPIILLGLLLLLHGFWRGRSATETRRHRRTAQVLAFPILCFGLQMHFAALSLLPLIVLIVFLGRRQIRWRSTGAGLTLAALTLLPYAIGLATTLEQDPTRVSDAMGRSVDSGLNLSGASLRQALELTTGAGLESWMAPDQSAEMASEYPTGWQLLYLLALGLVAGLIAGWRRRSGFVLALALWAFAPVAILLLDFTPSYHHYFVPSLPALALVCAQGFDALTRRRQWQWLLWLCLALLLALQIGLWQAALDFVARRHIEYPGFTTSLSKLLPIREALRQSEDALVISAGMAWNLNHEVAVWDTLLRGDVACVRTLVSDGYAVFPDQAFSALIAPDASLTHGGHPLAQGSPERFPTRAGGDEYVVYHWDAAPAWQGSAIRPISQARFSNGVSLTGYALADGEVTLEWRLPKQQVGEDYQYSAQAFDADGDRLAQWDARFWQGRHFCENDRLLTWGPLAIDEAAATLKVALYKLGEGKARGKYFNADVLDDMGNAIGHSVDIALVNP